MPYKSKPIEKRYFTISEVANQLSLSASILRYWESEFPILQPKKNRKGNRLFTQKDIEIIKAIKHLVKEEKFTLEGARSHLKTWLKNHQIEVEEPNLSSVEHSNANPLLAIKLKLVHLQNAIQLTLSELQNISNK